MKKMIICAGVFLSAIVFNDAKSQVRVHVNFNIGSQPVWGPAGYDYAEYYYLPDIETYYYVPTRQFIYLSDGRWIYSSSLPPRCRNYDLYNGYKVVVNEPRPYRHFRADRERYAGYRGNHSQAIIRNSDDPKYYVVRGHPGYNAGHDNGKGRDHDRHDIDRDHGHHHH
ncbi:MAG: hypothetical protein Q8941_13510 [Bacteroidota bacterium]|nr:hypothetical protein [Bacteroidota bacterium]